MALATQGDEVTVLCREVGLTPRMTAEENRKISGCRSGNTHLPVYQPPNENLNTKTAGNGGLTARLRGQIGKMTPDKRAFCTALFHFIILQTI